MDIRGFQSAGATAAVAALCLLSPLARAQTAAEMPTYQGADRAQKLLDGALKEGEVVLYSGVIVNQALRPLTAAFQKKYPAIKMTYWRGDSEDIAVKLGAEVRAGNPVADVVEGTGIGEMVARAGLAQPALSPEIAGVPERLRDPNHLWLPTRMSYFSAAYNTRLAPDDTAPKTYDDLLDPKWTGKMAWPRTAASGAPLFVTNLRMAWGEDKALTYLRKLATQRIVNFAAGSARTLVDRVIAGEYPIALAIYAHHPLISAAKGAPVNSRLLAPVASAAGTIALARGARHPSAAMLLVDFILSEEGQKILAAAEYFPARSDVEPLPQLAPIVPARAGVAENFISPDNIGAYTESSSKIIDDLFR